VQHETKLKLKELIAATGHVLDVEDFDDIAELDRLAQDVADPQSGIDSPLLNHAVFFRSVPVYPLTLAHLTFLDAAGEVLGVDDDERILCMLWISTIDEITDAHYDPDASRKAFRRWLRKSRWTTRDIESVIALRYEKIMSNANGTKKENRDGALIGLLSREYGESPEYWMSKAPLGVIEACVADWNAGQEAQAQAYRRANKGAAVAPPPSPKFIAMRLFRECAERMAAKWQKSAA